MKINVTIDLARKELLEAITALIESRNRYNYKFPPGTAAAIDFVGDVCRVTWGPEQPDPDEEITPAPVVPEPATVEVETTEPKAQEVVF